MPCFARSGQWQTTNTQRNVGRCFSLSRQQEPAIIVAVAQLVFFLTPGDWAPDLESEWVAFFNCEAVNKRIYCQDILIYLLLVRNGTEIEEGESLIEDHKGSKYSSVCWRKLTTLEQFLFYWQTKLCGNNVWEEVFFVEDGRWNYVEERCESKVVRVATAPTVVVSNAAFWSACTITPSLQVPSSALVYATSCMCQ